MTNNASVCVKQNSVQFSSASNTLQESIPMGFPLSPLISSCLISKEKFFAYNKQVNKNVLYWAR